MSAYCSSMAPVKKKLKDMSVEEFFHTNFDDESESSSTKSIESDANECKKSQIKANKKNKMSTTLPRTKQKREASFKGKLAKKNTKKASAIKERPDKTDSNNSMAAALKDNDPEFYDFLKGQDQKLLQNLEDLSDSGDETSENEDDRIVDTSSGGKSSTEPDHTFEKEILDMSSGDDSDDEDNGIHKLPDKLEVASDDSAADDDDDSEMSVKTKKGKGGTVLKHRMIERWTKAIKSKPTLPVLREIVSAFHAAVQEAGGAENSSASKYSVEDGAIFNSVVRLCLTQIVPAFQSMRILPNISEVQKSISDKSAAWKKMKVLVKSYINDLLELLSQLSEAAMMNAVLKHIHKLVVFYATFPKLTKLFLKRMIKLWATSEETTRVLAFLCIFKIVRLKQEKLLELCLKQMYVAYVSNCKFTSPTTLPLINFMQKALVEVLMIDETVAYQYAFVYIRQLAIHLRNAISVKKKNTCQAVYNWQFIHCLGLWTQLLCTTYPNDVLQPLIYPLTQTIIGTVKLLPTARFYPLRFLCVKSLNQLSLKTNTFIPTIPFLLEVFEQTDFNKRHKQVSLKPFNFAVILKFSKSQLHEKAFRDGLVDQLYELLLESYNVQAHSISFPELIIPSVLQLKDFLKKCKIANYCKQIKQIVDKVLEQSKFIVEKRKKSNISFDDTNAVRLWETQLADSGTPLRKYHTSWRKLRDRELQHEIANKEAISGAAIDIPTIERKKQKATPEEREDFSKLFENESDSEDETRFLLKEERPDKGANKRKWQDEESDSNDYSDFDDDELEQLAQSASSGDESAEMDDSVMDVSDDNDGVDNSSSEVSDEINTSLNRKTDKGYKKKKSNFVSESGSTKNNADEEDLVQDFNLSDYDD